MPERERTFTPLEQVEFKLFKAERDLKAIGHQQRGDNYVKPETDQMKKTACINELNEIQAIIDEHGCEDEALLGRINKLKQSLGWE